MTCNGGPSEPVSNPLWVHLLWGPSAIHHCEVASRYTKGVAKVKLWRETETEIETETEVAVAVVADWIQLRKCILEKNHKV